MKLIKSKKSYDMITSPELRLSYIFHDIVNLYIAGSLKAAVHDEYTSRMPEIDTTKTYSPHNKKSYADCKTVGLNITCRKMNGTVVITSLTFRDVSNQYVEIIMLEGIIPPHPDMKNDGYYQIFIPILDYKFDDYKIDKVVNKFTPVDKWLKDVGLTSVPEEIEVVDKKDVPHVKIPENKRVMMSEKQFVEWLPENLWNYDDTVELKVISDDELSTLHLECDKQSVFVEYSMLTAVTFHDNKFTLSQQLPKSIIEGMIIQSDDDINDETSDYIYTLRRRYGIFFDIIGKSKDGHSDVKIPIISISAFNKQKPDMIYYGIDNKKVTTLVSVCHSTVTPVVYRIYRFIGSN